jgi:hypothetical protein
MEINKSLQPSYTLALAAALPCAASALRTDVQGVAVRAWDAADATAAVKRERTAGIGHLGFATPMTALGSPAWSPPL